MKKILILFLLVVFLLTNVQCYDTSVDINRMDKLIQIKTYRSGGSEKKTVRWCTENGVVSKGMTLSECDKAVDGKFTLLVKLEDDWAIYVYKEHKVWFRDGIVSTIKNLKIERAIKMLKYIREERRKNPIWIR